jgi:xanthine dehydrogenase YagR molybdenum-binding subunit
VPVRMDVPEIDVIETDITPSGARGVGDAIANAVHNATAISVRELPISVDRLLAVGLLLTNRNAQSVRGGQ